jgi:uncharacterized protein (DUF1684 family)
MNRLLSLFPDMGSEFIKRLVASVFFAVLVIAMYSCSEPDHSAGKLSAPQDPMIMERKAKDAAFKSDDNSPIPQKDKFGFQGLSYYPINPDMRFSVRLNRYSAPQRVRLGTNTGEIRTGLRYGYFEFRVGDQNCRLQVYRLEDIPESGGSNLFIPFRDATTGHESYPAGRYIDLAENTSGIYVLDFNRAYNPYCAYNNKYSCPLPPAENTLLIPIRAGEKKYSVGSDPIGFDLFAPRFQCYYLDYISHNKGALCQRFPQNSEHC